MPYGNDLSFRISLTTWRLSNLIRGFLTFGSSSSCIVVQFIFRFTSSPPV